MAYTWTSAYSVGVDQIDEQHKELFNRINALIGAASQGKGKEEIGTTMRFLSDYVASHFADEERLQVRSGYPDYMSHKAEHARFLEGFSRLRREFEQNGATSTTVIAIQRHVGDWLINHIFKVDQELGKHVKAATAPAPEMPGRWN